MLIVIFLVEFCIVCIKLNTKSIKMRSILILSILLLIISLKAGAQTGQNDENILLKKMTDAIESKQDIKINSVLIARGDSTLYEHYFNGFSQDSLHDSRSSFKSITSLLIGIAIDKGMIKNTQQHVFDFFPEYEPFKNDDPRKRAMTIQNLLDMESGFDCEEFNDSKNCEDDMTATKDWVKFSLDLPMKNQPGTVWAYTSCNPMIISGIISKAAHMSIMNFAKRYLFDPLGITHYNWTVDPTGYGMTAGSFYIRPADMLKIGQLVRDGGKWHGKQLISKKWINESTKAVIPIPDFSFVRSGKSKTAIPQPTFYGDYWYREQLKTPEFQEDLLFASGNGGQYIFIIKRLNLVVVFTQSNYESWVAKRAFDVLEHYILPAYETGK
jgi:CubicO group peptidase (beta-lactamase class C family)